MTPVATTSHLGGKTGAEAFGIGLSFLMGCSDDNGGAGKAGGDGLVRAASGASNGGTASMPGGCKFSQSSTREGLYCCEAVLTLT